MQVRKTIVLDRESLEVISASAEAYSFIGQRFYLPFDKMILPEDLPAFKAQLRACSGVCFPVRLLNENAQPQLFLASASASANPQASLVTLLAAEAVLPALEEKERDIELKNGLLSLYGDEFFDYDAASGKLRIFRVDKYEQTVVEVTQDAFLEHIMTRVRSEDRDEAARFCADFRCQQATLHLKVRGHLMDPKRDAAMTLIKGVSLFEHGQYIGAAGVIHFGTRRGGVDHVLERDSLTGLLQKAEITGTAINLIDTQKQLDTTIAIVDVDRFKLVNDTLGHMQGDAVLRRVAAILVDEVGSSGLVGRIGGDEFMIIYRHVANMENNRELLRSIKNRVAAVYAPEPGGKPGITLSIGCASYPKDADCYEDVFRLADFAMYQAKNKGRNRYVIFDKAKHGEPAQVLQDAMSVSRLNNRGDMTVGDLMCTIMSQVFCGQGLPIEKLLEEAVVNLGLQRIILYAGTPWQVVCMAGEQRPDEQTLRETIAYLDNPALQEMYNAYGTLVLDNVERLSAKSTRLYRQMVQQGILSCVHIKGRDADGKPFLLSIESVSSRTSWNPQYVLYYELFRQIIGAYHLLDDGPRFFW